MLGPWRKLTDGSHHEAPLLRSATARVFMTHARMQSGGITRQFAQFIAAHVMRVSAISTSVTVIAPPIRVAIWAKGMSCMRLAAVRMATSPVPP